MTHHVHGPYIDWAALSPLVALGAGALIVLLVGLLRGAVARERVVPFLSLLTLATAIGLEIWRMGHPGVTIIAGALRIDDLALEIDMICAAAAITSVILSWRAFAPREAGHGEYHGLLLFSVMGMAVLVSASDIITLFLGLELLSIPLYVLCASEYRREGSLESGLKYLIIGSIGSATLLYGLAMLYGATGQTGFAGIARGLTTGSTLTDPLTLTGIALVAVGFAFKASMAPFHQWTPDVYEGAPTAVTAFMATATKAAALAVFIRFFDVALISAQTNWAPLLAAVATTTILVGNVGALGQRSLKRMLGYSGVAQAGYMVGGLVVATKLGISATVLYLAFYLMMNMAAFAVVSAVERDTGSDSLENIAGLGQRQPALAWPLTIAMFALAGIPGTVGFVGKFQLIHALVAGSYLWLAIVLVAGAMISLGYYLKVVAAIWIAPRALTIGTQRGAEMPAGAPAGLPADFRPIAGGSPELDQEGGSAYPELTLVALVMGAACILFGIIPGPLFTWTAHAGAAIAGLI
jgi:NADH-quinone oxidoreductase subunit N